MHVKDMRKSRPQNVNRYFFKSTVKHIYFVSSLHLFFAFFVYLNHYQDGVHVEQLPIHQFFEFVQKILTDNLFENLVEHKWLLSFIGYFEIEEFKYEGGVFRHCICNQFHLGSEHLLN